MENGSRRERKLVRIESYGCTANLGASEIMGGLLIEAGFEVTWGHQGKADLIILNTCVVKSPTHSRMRSRIRQIREKTPFIPLIVAGCMPQVYKEEIFRITSNVSVLGPHDLQNIVEVARKSLSGHFIKELSKRSRGEIRLNLPRIRTNSLTGIVQIARGCLSSCSYCIVRKIMGNVFSYPIEQVVNEIRSCIRDGCREVLLTAQDLAAYGADIGTSLTHLLKEVLRELPRNIRLRLGMLNPGHLQETLEDFMEIVSSKSVYSMLHLPVQSGDDEVLQRMGRSYTVSEFMRIITIARGYQPGLTIHTDIIVGFPGETEEDFQNTVNLMKWLKPDVVNISKFGPRPGTPAAQMKFLPSHVVKQRSKALTNLCEKISFEKNKNHVGTVLEALCLKQREKNMWFGRSGNYKPVVYTGKSSRLGELVSVRIEGATQTHLKGQECS